MRGAGEGVAMTGPARSRSARGVGFDALSGPTTRGTRRGCCFGSDEHDAGAPPRAASFPSSGESSFEGMVDGVADIARGDAARAFVAASSRASREAVPPRAAEVERETGRVGALLFARSMRRSVGVPETG